MKILLVFAMLCSIAQAQTPPSDKLDRFEITALSGVTAFKSLDVYSTQWMLHQHDKEVFLPGFIANHPAVMSAYYGATISAETLLVMKLNKHHRKIARLIPVIDCVGTAYWGIHNLTLNKAKP